MGSGQALPAGEIHLPLGAPTSVGSLPHTDREAAVSFVLERTPELPAAPTVPVLEPLEQMIPQAAWGIAGVYVADDGTISVADPEALDPLAPLGDRDLLVDGEVIALNDRGLPDFRVLQDRMHVRNAAAAARLA